MKTEDGMSSRTHSLLDRDELEGVLSGAFYNPTKSRGRAHREDVEKPTHYKVICISMYTDDLARLDEMIDALKAKGLTKASRSALIRHALSNVDLDKVPRGI